MDREQSISFRGRFREARAAVEKDESDCMAIIHVLEDFGQVLTGKRGTIEKYQKCITAFVRVHNPTDAFATDYHIDFDKLYRIVQKSRNRAAHEGARSRYFAPRVVELSLMIEDALMRNTQADELKDYMVMSPVIAYTWEPLSIIRKAMLSNSFTHIPYRRGGKWFVVSDSAIARYLRTGDKYSVAKLNTTLGKALDDGMKSPKCPIVASPNTKVYDVLRQVPTGDSSNDLPILVTHPKNEDYLLGILTYSDLM